ncbi:hypothetical protein [Deinococcus sp. NW-56]|uniref:hypothetical protein n=1 Tax=Deinococcus sp. NW-56 TaxID=2080419 RepID=UPI000CF4F016|nr:hypothetical protein [Deinococcus sp. NW-56]
MTLPLSAALTDLLAYYGPLASERAEVAGGVALHTPGVNVLGLNAAFLPGAAPERLREAATWQRSRGHPPLVAVPGRARGTGEEIASLRCGVYRADSSPSPFTAEQVSRLHLPRWAAVLAEAHGTPEWGSALARHLARSLEGRRDYALMLAYAGSEAVGALLWQAAGAGGRAHLWGTLDPAVDGALLNGAATLGEFLLASVPPTSPISVVEGEEIGFFLMNEDGNP